MKKNIVVLFLIPLSVGLIIAFFQFFLPKLTKDRKELSYTIFDPISLIDNRITKDLDVKINNVATTSLFSSQINIENTGNTPIKDVPISIVFPDQDSSLIIYNYNIVTNPKYEFGEIGVDQSRSGLRLLAELINPKDEIYISVIINKEIKPEFFSKVEDMNLEESKPETENNIFLSIILPIIASGLSLIVLVFLQYKKIISFEIGGFKINFDMIENAKKQPGLKIINATYGKGERYLDVTRLLNSLVKDNQLNINVNNDLFGDPYIGQEKELKVIYSYGEEIETTMIYEHEDLIIPNINAI